jgi:hypothetical protein
MLHLQRCAHQYVAWECIQSPACFSKREARALFAAHIVPTMVATVAYGIQGVEE